MPADSRSRMVTQAPSLQHHANAGSYVKTTVVRKPAVGRERDPHADFGETSVFWWTMPPCYDQQILWPIAIYFAMMEFSFDGVC